MMKGIKYIALLLLVAFTLGCQRDLYNFPQHFSIPKVSNEPPLIEYIVDYANDDNVLEHKNIKKVADYTKLPYQDVPLQKFNGHQTISTSTRVLCIYETYGLTDSTLDSVFNFVARGGTLFLTNANNDPRLTYLIGLKPDASLTLDGEAYGFHFVEPMFPGLNGSTFERDKSAHKGFALENFSNSLDILASAANNKKYPLIVKNSVGKGNVVYFNSVVNMGKGFRGLMFANVLLGLEGVPYPVANASTIFLDDYPSPLYNIYKEPIKSEMNFTIAEFVTNVWWPDMKILAQNEKIKYTAYVTFDYSDYIAPPFTFREWDKNKFQVNGVEHAISSWLGRDIYKNGHELGFHGYNHTSLIKEEWKQPEYIITALNAATKKWRTLDFGELPISYVPPSNYIDSVGLAKLMAGMPSIKYIQSNYLGNFDEGGNREFDPEPYNDYFFNYPRVSSGYCLGSESIWAIESLYLFTGIWTHFVHPDDVYQIPDKSNTITAGHFEYRNRNGLNWYSKNGKLGMYDTFKELLGDFRKRHPLVRYLGATEASELVKDWRYTYFTHSRNYGKYIVESDFGANKNSAQYWFAYVSEANTDLIDNKLTSNVEAVKKTPFLQGHLYQIKTKNGFLGLPDLMLAGKSAEMSNKGAIEMARTNYGEYLKSRAVLVPLAEQVDKFISEGKLDRATNLLATRIRDHVQITDDQWGEYAKLMVWQEKGNEVWNLLEEQYQNKQSKKLADLSRKIRNYADYPSMEVRERWLNRQIDWGTDDVDVLNEYVAYFNTKERKSKILKVLHLQATLEPDHKNNKRYLTHLINNGFDGVVPELNNIRPCDENYAEIATLIAWTYADHLYYDRALAWEKCSGEIALETATFWLVNSRSLDSLRHTDYPRYLELLMANDPKKALTVLQIESPCEVPQIENLSKQIAMLYADFEQYQKAVDWAKCTSGLAVTKKMHWLANLKQYDEMKKIYDTHIEENPDDYIAKLQMATLLMDIGNTKASVKIAANLPIEIEQGPLKERINSVLKYLSFGDQVEVLQNYGNIIYPDVKKIISKNIRLREGNSVSTESYAINDKFVPKTISNILSYNIYDKRYNIHSFSGTQSLMYPLNVTDEVPENERRNLIGFEYRFKRAMPKKIGYSGRARIERDDTNKIYYQLGAGLSVNSEKSFNSVGLDHFPVRNGPGYVLGIYHTKLTNYNEFVSSSALKQIISFEGNYYSDNEMDGTILLRSEFAVVKMKDFRLSPLVEIAYTLGTIDRRNGYPYWMDDNRLFGGGGISLKIGSEKTKFSAMADASIFAEDNEASFQRYTGNLSYRIKNFTTIKARYEIYTIKNYYSNVFGLGMVHNFNLN